MTDFKKLDEEFENLCIEYAFDDFVDAKFWKDKLKSFLHQKLLERDGEIRQIITNNVMKLPAEKVREMLEIFGKI